MSSTQQEFWLSGPIPGIDDLLQPVAHALLQAEREIAELMNGFPDRLLAERPAQCASPAFHLLHIPGVIDRLFTYAQGRLLDEQQLRYLKEESIPNPTHTTADLVAGIQHAVHKALDYLGEMPRESLTEIRYVGRKKIPATTIGLLFHGAEHTMRHTGQLLVTVRMLLSTHNSVPGQTT